jgi:hypothetical protein
MNQAPVLAISVLTEARSDLGGRLRAAFLVVSRTLAEVATAAGGAFLHSPTPLKARCFSNDCTGCREAASFGRERDLCLAIT